MFGWQREVHNALPAGGYALEIFFEAAQVHGAHLHGLQAQTPFPHPQEAGLQLHPFCFVIVCIVFFSFIPADAARRRILQFLLAVIALVRAERRRRTTYAAE